MQMKRIFADKLEKSRNYPGSLERFVGWLVCWLVFSQKTNQQTN